ncbi:heat shock protein 70kD, peptide-binding domain-containing protein [Plectosphaerella cucumerina]|uniref:Heat shock protein 70kD, peptide-binding domain-containing protein n=1 Tax=Plectosphaerella cucumerina TaxID=40658 RepID=A0A8K0X215_9PEZI|nr:heat shock protein 70kD, peptide-binding domain-containing protein [Plectosphaerella cucumerina]
MPLAIQINAVSQRAGMLVNGTFESIPINQDDLSLPVLLSKNNTYKKLPILPNDTPLPTSISQWYLHPDPLTPLAVPFAGRIHALPIHEAYTLTTRALTAAATTHFNRNFPTAVLTIPHRFDEAHRHLVKTAASDAGLEPLQVMHEGIAAAIAHGLDRTDKEEVRILILSVDGGGLSSLELLLCDEGVFDNLASVNSIHYTTIEDLIPRLRSASRQILADANISPSDIDYFLPIGASPDLIPAQTFLTSLLNLTASTGPPSPADAVITGAASHASIYYDDDIGFPGIEITPLSLGIESVPGVFRTVVRRFTLLPTVKTLRVRPAFQGQTSLRLRIFVGERALAVDNVFLGEVEFDLLPLALESYRDVEVRFEVDDYLTKLVVSVKDERSGEVLEQELELEGQMRELPLEDMHFAAEAFAERDDALRRLAGDVVLVGGRVGDKME